MKKTLLIHLWAIVLSIVFAQAQTPAFPGAEGAGMYTTGGRGGSVVRVTTLEDNASGSAVISGSLRWALNQASPKTIVFDVSGTINLKQQLKSGKDNITIAGQTAPGDGICIAGYDFVINSNNLIIRFLRFRPGDGSGNELDGLGGMDKKDIIIDHCSISWSVDESLSVYGIENLTVQWCLASEALRVSVHNKGTHCYGGNWGGNKASYHHNMIAHSESRTPRLGPRPSTQENEYVDIRNNVFYNWAGEGCYGGEGMNVNLVNNYYKPGPATDKASSAVKYRITKIGVRTEEYVTSNPSFAPMKHVWGKFYIDGNKVDGNAEVTNDNWTKGVYAQQSNGTGVDNLWTATTKDTIRLSQPLNIGTVSTHSADIAYDRVLSYVGCCLSRDAVDQRIVSDVRNREATFTVSGNKAGYINTPSDTKPAGASDTWSAWPTLNQVGSIVDSNKDGIPDGWLEANYPNKKSTDTNEDGYTYLEVYMNSLVKQITDAQYEGAQSTGISNEYTDTKEKTITYYDVNSNNIIVKSDINLTNIQVYNLAGGLVRSLKPDSNEAYIDTTGLGEGVFVVKTKLDNNNISVSKVIK